MPKRKLNAVRLREPVHGKRALTLDREMNQECSICLEQFWDPTCIIGCPADVCNALMCSHCAVKQHGLGVMRNSARTTEVHTCFSCRNDRHSVGEKGVPVSDPTPPRQGMHLRTLTSNGGISSWMCGYHKYWPTGKECSVPFDTPGKVAEHMKNARCGDYYSKCPHNGCDKRGQVRWLFEEHVPFCEKQFNSAEPCGDCGVFEDARDDQGLHGYVCKQRITRCPMCESYFSRRCTMSKHLDENQEQGGLCDDNDHICDIQVVNMIYCRREWSESQFIAVASFQISKRQDKVWRVKNNAYDILLVISPAKDGKTRIVPFVYSFDDIHSASAKDIPRYCLKIVITGDGIGTSQSFSLSAYKFMTGEQPTKDMQGLYPSVSWTEEERCGANAVRNVMVSAEMHSDAMQASNRAFCPQEWRPQSPDFSQGNGTPLSSPRYQSGSHGSRSPEMA